MLKIDAVKIVGKVKSNRISTRKVSEQWEHFSNFLIIVFTTLCNYVVNTIRCGIL